MSHGPQSTVSATQEVRLQTSPRVHVKEVSMSEMTNTQTLCFHNN